MVASGSDAVVIWRGLTTVNAAELVLPPSAAEIVAGPAALPSAPTLNPPTKLLATTTATAMFELDHFAANVTLTWCPPAYVATALNGLMLLKDPSSVTVALVGVTEIELGDPPMLE